MRIQKVVIVAYFKAHFDLYLQRQKKYEKLWSKISWILVSRLKMKMLKC